ncbi:MAG: ATP-binding protein [Planctomycetota bacterium]
MRSVYRQLCAVLAASLLTFGVLVAVLWTQLKSAASQDLADKASRVAHLLLPDAGLAPAEQQAALEQLAEAVEIDLMLLDTDGNQLAVTGTHSLPSLTELVASDWSEVQFEKQWATRLPDGRYVSVAPRNLLIIDDTNGIVAMLALMALVVGLAAYPFIRRLTSRLKRLQRQVERVGSGDLKARVDVNGRDEISQLARSFNTSAERIEGLVKSQRLLLAHTSHELRTPLARIRMGLELLNTADDDEERARELRQDITELDELIDELLLMSRLAAGLDAKSVRRLDLVALVAEECSRYPTCSLTAMESLHVCGEPASLRRVVRNLIENAYRHGEEPVDVSVVRNEGEVLVTVADCGPGIPTHEQEAAWQPFHRTDTSASRPGYGLGLALVRRTSEAHHGSVEMQSGDGFRIIVKLPIATSDVPEHL